MKKKSKEKKLNENILLNEITNHIFVKKLKDINLSPDINLRLIRDSLFSVTNIKLSRIFASKDDHIRQGGKGMGNLLVTN